MSERPSFSRSSILIGFCIFSLLVLFFISTMIIINQRGEPDSPPAYSQDIELATHTTPVPTTTSTIFQPLTENTQTPITSAAPMSVCAQAWGIQPPAALPEWLSTPQNAESLNTEVKYVILAGKLISFGIVNASDCPDGGLTGDGAANTCGMEKAYSQVVSWQNQFDQEILTAAQDNQIPAQIIKRLFAQETQFWPPNSFAPSTYGIGNVTSPGIEPLFMWYDDIYQDTCRAVFSQACVQPYHTLSLQDQQVLRGFFISQYLHAYCATCPNGIDLEKIERSIDYFAKLIVANCHQVDLILNNHGFSTETISYEDAWRLTLANYTVGAGCVINAVEDMDLARGFSWEYFTDQLTSDCSVDIYINRITSE